MIKTKQLTPEQVKRHYDQLTLPLNSEDQQKVNELKQMFADKISSKQKDFKDALPVIDLTNMIIKEYQQVFGWVDEAYSRFIFKGSRGSAKTTFAVQFIIIDMLLDSQASWFTIMENKVQHSDTTMLEFKEWIDRIDIMWAGFANKWEKKDGQSIKEWVFKHNGNEQKVKFIGLDEASRGTITPPANNYWSGFWVEEVVSSDEQFGADMDKKKEKFDALNTLRASSIRFFNRNNGKKKHFKHIRFKELWTFNPYNEEEPALENFNKYLPDNMETLMSKGFDYATNRELDEVYITSNYISNPFLPEEFRKFMERTAKEKIGAWETIVYGKTGSPINTVYQNIYHILDKQQLENVQYNTKGYSGLTNFVISIDVGNGGEGQMTMGLFAKNAKGEWFGLAEWGSKDYEAQYGFDSEKIAIHMWKIIKEWNDHYVNFRDMNTIPIVMDNDIHFKAVFEKMFNTLNLTWKTTFKVSLFKDKYLSVYKNEKRPAIIRHLISSGSFKIYKKYTPTCYSQLRATKMGKSGKLLDGNDDFRQMMEMSLFHIAKEIAIKEFNENKLFDKDMIDFIKSFK